MRSRRPIFDGFCVRNDSNGAEEFFKIGIMSVEPRQRIVTVAPDTPNDEFVAFAKWLIKHSTNRWFVLRDVIE